MKCFFAIFFILNFQTSHCQSDNIRKDAKAIINYLKKNNQYNIGAKDTLIDLNGDHYKDLLIEYYGESGTGLKNRIKVYLYDKLIKRFRPCEQLNNLANPTFNFQNKTVAGYYIAIGGGSAIKLKWNGLRLDTLEQITIEVISEHQDESFKLNTFNYITKKKSTKILKMIKLPQEYMYMNYKPIIKRK